MNLLIPFRVEEAVFTAGAIETTIEKTRDFLRDTDSKYPDLNKVHREYIGVLKEAHKGMLVSLREAGLPMTERDIEDLPLDRQPQEAARVHD